MYGCREGAGQSKIGWPFFSRGIALGNEACIGAGFVGVQNLQLTPSISSDEEAGPFWGITVNGKKICA